MVVSARPVVINEKATNMPFLLPVWPLCAVALSARRAASAALSAASAARCAKLYDP